MKRYAIIDKNFKREMVLLQGGGCKWRRCTFCDYHTDVSKNAYEINVMALNRTTGVYGVLDIINSGSAMELDSQTIAYIKHIVEKRKIHTLWFEAHYMYREQIKEFAQQFAPATVKFRCGIESFDEQLRSQWRKGIPKETTITDISRYYNGVCLLCCTEGDSRERILHDIALAQAHFEYASINVFNNNTTEVRRDEELVEWFVSEVAPSFVDSKQIEVLIENTDLGVG